LAHLKSTNINRMKAAYITHPTCKLHDMGSKHPDSPERLNVIEQALVDEGLMAKLDSYVALPASREHLLAVHDPEHVNRLFGYNQVYADSIFEVVTKQEIIRIANGTFINPHSMQAAELAAGSVIQATELIMSGCAESVFCSVRPGGHHAEKNKAMGFCLFNNVMVGVLYALMVYRLKKVVIVDFDVHHGNGTENIAKGNPNILYISLFQHPLFPYPNLDSPADNIIHCPLTKGSNGDDYREAFEHKVIPALRHFKPELMYISSGFDAHENDPLGGMNLQDADFHWMTEKLVTESTINGKGRVISVLEGGYDKQSLSRSVCQHIRALMKMPAS